MTGYADTLIEGRIFCGLHEGFAEALAIAGDRIVACGTRSAVFALAGPGTRRVALDGRRVPCPPSTTRISTCCHWAWP